MRHGKTILNVDKAHCGETAFLQCCWEDCRKPGTTLHKALSHDHAKGYPCDHEMSKHTWFVFCSERHRQLFKHSHISKGNLPTGERGRIL